MGSQLFIIPPTQQPIYQPTNQATNQLDFYDYAHGNRQLSKSECNNAHLWSRNYAMQRNNKSRLCPSPHTLTRTKTSSICFVAVFSVYMHPHGIIIESGFTTTKSSDTCINRICGTSSFIQRRKRSCITFYSRPFITYL